ADRDHRRRLLQRQGREVPKPPGTDGALGRRQGTLRSPRTPRRGRQADSRSRLVLSAEGTTARTSSELRRRRAWTAVEWVSFSVGAAAPVLVMTPRRAGFLTNRAADLTLPAWLYIALRGTRDSARVIWPRRFMSAPPLVFAVLFAASTATEVSQYFWP